MHKSNPRLIILSRDVDQYHALWKASASSEAHLILATSDVTDVIQFEEREQATILLSEPDLAVQVIEYLPNLQWCQSTWAGNAPLLNHPKRDYILSGVKGIFSQQMSEYILSYILSHVRQHTTFNALQNAQQWCPPTLSSISDLTIGVMGTGNIATGMLNVFDAFNTSVIGLSRRGEAPQSHPKMRMFKPHQLTEFITSADVIINLLPDTPDTQSFININTIETLIEWHLAHLAPLPNKRLFINAGRGSVITDEALLSALDNHVFTRAVLDVFTIEPLPTEHIFWHRNDIVITQHTAAISKPSSVMQLFMDNLSRYTKGQSPLYVMNWQQGY